MNEFLPENLSEFLERNDVPFSQNGRSFLLTCPRCQKPKKLWILKKNGYFVCWHCKETENFKGRVEFALSEILGKSLDEIRGQLYAGGVPPGMALDIDLKDFSEDDLVEMPQTILLDEIELPPGVRSAWTNDKSRLYLEGRGIPVDVMRRYQITYWPLKQRVIFPVIVNGSLVGYQARAIYPDPEIKILTSTGLRREHVLMFQDRLKNSDHAIICEGPVDAIKADLCGGNVATMGKAVSRQQLEIIKSYGITKIYLALDPDAAEEVERLAIDLGDLDTHLILPPNGRKDLGECSFDEVFEAYQNAKPFTSGNVLIHLNTPRFF